MSQGKISMCSDVWMLEWLQKKSFKAQTKSELYVDSDSYNFKPYLYVIKVFYLPNFNNIKMHSVTEKKPICMCFWKMWTIDIHFKLIHNVDIFCLLIQAWEAKDMVRKQTGIVYDRRMTEHKCIWDLNYPECPERFTRVLERYGIV